MAQLRFLAFIPFIYLLLVLFSLLPRFVSQGSTTRKSCKRKKKKSATHLFPFVKIVNKKYDQTSSRARLHAHMDTHDASTHPRIHASTHPRTHAHNTPVVLSVFFSAVYGHRSRGDGRSQMGRMINARSGLVPGTYVHITHTHAHFRRALTHMRA
jgi:hypothetical protein